METVTAIVIGILIIAVFIILKIFLDLAKEHTTSIAILYKKVYEFEDKLDLIETGIKNLWCEVNKLNKSLRDTTPLPTLLELLPKSIKTEKNGETFLSISKNITEDWVVEYFFDDRGDEYILEERVYNKDLIDAVVEMLLKLKEKKISLHNNS